MSIQSGTLAWQYAQKHCVTTDVDRMNSKMYIFGVHTLRDMSAPVYTTSHRTPFGQRNVISFLLATRCTSGILIMCKPWHFTVYGQQKRFQLRMTTAYRRGKKRSRLDCFQRRIAKRRFIWFLGIPNFLKTRFTRGKMFVYDSYGKGGA